MKYIRLWSLLLSGFVLQANAEDIELYVKHRVNTQEKFRVLIIFDTSGSMAFSSETGYNCGYNYNTGRWVVCPDSRLEAAKKAIDDLVVKNPDIDFGLMRLYDDDGGYVMAGIGSDQSTVRTKISRLEANGATPLSEALWEAYLYLSGSSTYYANKFKFKDRDLNVESRGVYLSPFTALDRCDNSVNIIYMTDGDPSSDTEQESNIFYKYYEFFNGYPRRTSGSYLSSLATVLYGSKTNQPDLYPATRNVRDFARVYTIGFGNGMSADGELLLEKTAADGGGQYLKADNAQKLREALDEQINSIRAISGSFSSPSVAVSSTDQTQSKDSLYFTMFYPETHARWQGNLKKLKVKNAQIVDMANKPALDENGLIDSSASTYWSGVNARDGNQVKSGGVADVLYKQSQRTLYSNYNGSSLKAFNYSTALSSYGSQSSLATAFALDKSQVIYAMNWAYGFDVFDENDNGSTYDRRKDIFGDPLHSKPVTMDYGNDDIRVIVGTNAGFLHMFKDKGDTVEESWAFIPGELLSNIKPQMNKTADVKVYGMDGPLTVYFDDKNKNGIVESGDTVILIAGMRRGGNSYYAIDITNPDAPSLKWTIEGGRGDFTELGQTWSRPLVTNILYSGKTPVAIFAAGYDTNKDNVTKSADSKGRGIYIVNALTGRLVWSSVKSNGFKGNHSMPADVFIMDSDYDGYTDRIYASDTGGGIWRFDLPSATPNSSSAPWTHFQLADLAGDITSQDRRFFYRPLAARTVFSKVKESVSGNTSVKTRRDTPYEAIVIGTGNRSKPTGTGTTEYLFVLRDENTVTQSFTSSKTPKPIVLSDLMSMNGDPFKQVLTDYDKFVDVEVELAKFKGWKYQLGVGEKSLASATVAGGIAYFTTFTPAELSSNQCSLTGGKGQLYAFHLHYGTQVYEQLKYETSYEVPDTPKLYFGCEGATDDNRCTNTIRMVGPAIKKGPNSDASQAGPQAGTPWASKKLLDSPEPVFENGKVKLLDDAVPIGFGLRTIQSYIYKKEQHDEKK
ncbi:PilC/PilY family type IV pilus protein [Pseudoalteromonas fenneropenaei]|uniref:PilC/PilY family type IV pilus protein n=1 Tax=Pseudoalteromonas fenneropenaei TaxID=1737459 RepID=A0ABV7CMV8_9GAMM